MPKNAQGVFVFQGLITASEPDAGLEPKTAGAEMEVEASTAEPEAKKFETSTTTTEAVPTTKAVL